MRGFDTEVEAMDHGGRNWSSAATSQGMRQPPEAARDKERFLP